MVFANGKKKLLPLIPLIPLIAALAACGGGGGGSTTTTTTDTTTVTGLTMPVTMSALAASSSGSGAPGVKGLVMDFYGAYKAITTQTFASTSNYVTDETHTYVFDASMESLQTVNMILCLMDQVKATEMVNEGAYIALVNEDKCEQGQNKGGGGGSTGQSSGQTVSYNKWIINSTRASNTDSQIVKIWVPGDPGSMDGDILVEVTVAEGVSTTKPYGDFVLNFKGMNPDTSEQTMGGTLKTVSQATGSTKSQFQYFNLGGADLSSTSTLGFAWTEKSNVILNDATGTGGQARTYRKEQSTNGGNTYGREATYAVAFDSSLVLRDGTAITSQNGTPVTATAQACMSRTAFNKQVWRYNLYHETAGTFNGSAVTAGQRVTLNSGFPFKTADGKFGHVGYWGIWMEGNTTPADGATITKVDYSSTATGADYTVNIAPGRLIRRTANTETMTSLQGAELYYWGQVGSTFGNYLATVDTNNNFIATDTVAWGQNGRTLTPLPAGTVGVNGYQTTPIPGYNVTPSTTGQNLWLWSDALGGNVTYVHDTAITDPALRKVTFYAQEYVMPGDATLFAGGSSATVKCYDRCLKGGLDATAITAMGTNESLLYYPTNGTAYSYTVSSSGGKVTVNDDTNTTQPAPVSADGLNLSALGHDWGASTGEMVTAAVAATLVNPWDLYDPTKVATSYRWETGSNQWNKMITVTAVANGALASFDKPLQFTYTHSTADDANADTAYNAKKFQLQYGGPGELWGFPWMEDTTNPGHWRSAVTLKDGVVLTDGTNSFVAKAIEQEQTMKYAGTSATDTGPCTTATLDVTGLNDTAMPFLTASGTVSFGLTDKPTVTTAPAVIEGVLQ